MNDEKLESAKQSLRAMASKARPAKELAWREIQNGMSVEFVAMKYNLTADDVAKAKQRLRKIEEQRNAANQS